jgi:crossover junction endodeoxyribonuclease RuvC
MEKERAHRIMGIDPGTNILGYSIIEIRKKKTFLVDYGVINMKKHASGYGKLQTIFKGVQELIVVHQPAELAIEAPFFGKNVQSMLKLGRAQGVAIAAAMTQNLEVTEYSPKKIKKAITGKGGASKEQVASMVQTLLGVKIDQNNHDATDALAVALCHHYQSGTLPGASKRYNDWGAFLNDNPDRKAR